MQVPKPEPKAKKPKPLRKQHERPEREKRALQPIRPISEQRRDNVDAFSKQTQLGRQILTVEDYKDTAKNEHELQEACESYLRENKIYFVHVPDAAYKNRRSGHSLLGVPDLIILAPNPSDKFNRCLLVELKAKSGTIGTGQARVARTVNVHEIRSFLAFKDLVNDFFSRGIL